MGNHEARAERHLPLPARFRTHDPKERAIRHAEEHPTPAQEESLQVQEMSKRRRGRRRRLPTLLKPHVNLDIAPDNMCEPADVSSRHVQPAGPLQAAPRGCPDESPPWWPAPAKRWSR